jgi:molecular chaperone GrpE
VTQNDESTSRAESSSAPASTPDASAEPAAAAAAPNPLEQVTAERDRFKDQLLRTAADFDNFRKRSKRDIDDARQRGKDDVVRDLLPVFDNLERAVQTADTASDLRSVVDGVRMVLKLFEDTAERTGLERIKSVGERFDPSVHEAIQQQETDAHPPGTIVAEITPGYRFGQRLLRPALVVVARKPSEPKPEDSGSKTNGSGGPSVPAAEASAEPAPKSQRPPKADAKESE